MLVEPELPEEIHRRGNDDEVAPRVAAEGGERSQVLEVEVLANLIRHDQRDADQHRVRNLMQLTLEIVSAPERAERPFDVRSWIDCFPDHPLW